MFLLPLSCYSFAGCQRVDADCVSSSARSPAHPVILRVGGCLVGWFHDSRVGWVVTVCFVCRPTNRCFDCHNTPQHTALREKAVLKARARDPNAFRFDVVSVSTSRHLASPHLASRRLGSCGVHLWGMLSVFVDRCATYARTFVRSLSETLASWWSVVHLCRTKPLATNAVTN